MAASLQFFSTTCPRLNSKINPETARQAAQEDRDELERERKLREQFVNKIHQQYPQYTTGSPSGSSNHSTNTGGPSSSSTPPPFPGFQQAWKQAWEQAGQQASANPTTGQSMARLFFFAASIYLIIMVSNMRNPNSPLMVMQGIPWWQVPTDTVMAFSLIRLLVGMRDQRSIKTDYEAAVKQEPQLGFTQFLNRRYPTVLAGHRTQQAEILAALSACHIASRDFKVSDTIYRVIKEKGTRDPKLTIDALMEALYSDFPYVFAPQPIVQVPGGYPVGQVATPLQDSGLRVDMTAGQSNSSEFKSM